MKKKLLIVVVVLASALILGSVLIYSRGIGATTQASANNIQDPSAVYLKLDGIDGESQDVNHTGWIDILSYNWGVNHTASKGGAFGLPKVNDMCFTTLVSKASPKLMLACANGKIIKTAVLSVTGKFSADGQIRTFLNITMKNAIVSSYKVSGNGEELPMDSFCLNFASITMDYILYDVAGAVGGVQHFTSTWNVATNQFS
jgi:type VI secretion system secreted protein Hcp